MDTLRGESGVSLVETLVTFMLIGIAMTAFFAAIIGGLQSLSESRARQAASQVATEVIEGLRARAPAEIAMYVVPLLMLPDEFDSTTVSCGGTLGAFDPDGGGPIGCEPLAENELGAIHAAAPYQGSVVSSVAEIRVVTIATQVVDSAIPAGTTRVTVVVSYDLPRGSKEVRRSTLFSEVSRG
jgi:type II secretory pathway pseudopilin PulG